MLWSQIKLTPYDLKDLQITVKIDNRPGIGRFLRNLSCVVTNRTGAGRRLYMITPADARQGTIRHTCSFILLKIYLFYLTRMKYILVAMICKLISKFAIILPKNMLLKWERLRLSLTVMEVKTTLLQTKSTCSLHVIYPQLLKRDT